MTLQEKRKLYMRDLREKQKKEREDAIFKYNWSVPQDSITSSLDPRASYAISCTPKHKRLFKIGYF